LQTECHHVAKFHAERPAGSATVKSREEIIHDNRKEINKDYASKARFKGKQMSMGKAAREKVYQEINKRLDATNIDKVAIAMSSNKCENFFSVLTKYTQGKRLYFGRTDGYLVRNLFCCC
jgi:RNA-binding protein YhbY